MSNYTILVTDRKLGGTSAHGLFRSMAKANQVIERCFRDLSAVEYRDPEEYDVEAKIINGVE
jgi:hypothetical protein